MDKAVTSITVGALPRKAPKQLRSLATVDAILDAAARVLVSQGYAHASTNRIAQVAGISVGSLYQYFPSKQALMIALQRRHALRVSARIRQAVDETLQLPLAQAVETLVNTAVDAYLDNPSLYRALEELLPYRSLYDERGGIEATVRGALLDLLSSHRADLSALDLELTATVLMHTVRTLIYSLLVNANCRWDVQRVRDEIRLLALRYLGGSPAPGALPQTDTMA